MHWTNNHKLNTDLSLAKEAASGSCFSMALGFCPLPGHSWGWMLEQEVRNEEGRAAPEKLIQG